MRDTGPEHMRGTYCCNGDELTPEIQSWYDCQGDSVAHLSGAGSCCFDMEIGTAYSFGSSDIV